MAMKDWEKIGINRFRKNNIVLDISQNIASKRWEVTVASPMSGYYFVDKKFKTKSQALAYAKSYMRNH